MIQTMRRLWRAVLLQAYDDLLKDPGLIANRLKRAEILHYRRDAYAWFNASDVGPRGFIWVCDILEINPQAARSALIGDKHHEIQDH